MGNVVQESERGALPHPADASVVRPELPDDVEVGTQTFTVLAQELDDTARAELWPKLVAKWPKPAAGSPDLGAAQALTTRQFPVFLLTRQD